jgi:acyl-CoA dehydrogenase
MAELELLEPFERMLKGLAPLERLRAADAGGGTAELWDSLTVSGFLDALVPEAVGGVGLALRDVGPLIEALGRHPLPVPVAHTMVARALLADAGQAVPSGPIILATGPRVVVEQVPMARIAEYAVVDGGDVMRLISLSSSHHAPFSSSAIGRLGELCALLRATEMAGLGDRILEMSVSYANERTQFGTQIGKMQAIQQQLAVLAEKVVMVRMSARIGYDCDLLPSPAAAAAAKAIASAAAVDITAIAHAVHGAIGISEEHDLPLFTRRLHEYRLADGGEGYWTGVLGMQRLTTPAMTSLDFIRGASGLAGQ